MDFSNTVYVEGLSNPEMFYSVLDKPFLMPLTFGV